MSTTGGRSAAQVGSSLLGATRGTVSAGQQCLSSFCSSAPALSSTTAAIKEWFGLAVYRLRGWA